MGAESLHPEDALKSRLEEFVDNLDEGFSFETDDARYSLAIAEYPDQPMTFMTLEIANLANKNNRSVPNVVATVIKNKNGENELVTIFSLPELERFLNRTEEIVEELNYDE